VSGHPIAGPSNNPQGDFFQVAYDPHNRLNVVWTQATGTEATADDVESGVYSEIYYARQR
jgi:hypothetical protein